MIKKLLLSCAVAAVALSANAKDLWTADDAGGFTPDWGNPVMLTPEQMIDVNSGDIISIKAEAVASGWHQLLIQAPRPEEEGGWIAFGGQGGLSAGDIVNIPVIPAIKEMIDLYGMAVQGDNGVTINKITVEQGTVELGPNTVWFGPAKSTWTMYSIRPFAFANVKVGDKIVIDYDKASAESTFQFMFGGYGQLCLATYENLSFITVDEENGQITCELVEELASYEQEDKTFDAFKLLKDNGLSFQGKDMTINEISLIPAQSEDPGPGAGISSLENESVESSVLYNVFGQPVDDNYRGIVIKNGKKIMKK